MGPSSARAAVGGPAHRFDAPRPATQRRKDRQAEKDDAQREFDEFETF
ncbi:hypothetical protein ACIRSU_17390 [Streptomyces sp. NPDC101160]